uniref:Retrotransposon gag domain-containing protein n=1 Tax=Anopheles dirus TaxID=7168 RepID=A0A182NA32_9DIPT
MSDSESESFAAATTGPYVTERKKTHSDEIAALRKMVIELQQKLEQAVQPKEEVKKEEAAASVSENVVGEASTPNRQDRNEVAGRVPDIRELREVIHPFDPKDATCPEAAMWLERFEETSEVYGWMEAVKLHCARLSLGGCAKLWWEGNQSQIKTWKSFKEALVAGFPAAENQAFYHTWLSNRKWRKDETPTEYVYVMLAMGRKGRFSEETTTSYIVNGLCDMWRRARSSPLSSMIKSITPLSKS